MATFKAVDLLTKPGYMGAYGDAILAVGKVTPTALGNGDILRPVLLKAGWEVSAIIVANDDLDSNGTPTAVFRMGYTPVSSNDGALAADDDYFAAAGQTLLQAAQDGKVYAKFDPKKFEQDAFLDLLANTGAATFAAGSVWVVVLGRAVGVK